MADLHQENLYLCRNNYQSKFIIPLRPIMKQYVLSDEANRSIWYQAIANIDLPLTKLKNGHQWRYLDIQTSSFNKISTHRQHGQQARSWSSEGLIFGLRDCIVHWLLQLSSPISLITHLSKWLCCFVHQLINCDRDKNDRHSWEKMSYIVTSHWNVFLGV